MVLISCIYVTSHSIEVNIKRMQQKSKIDFAGSKYVFAHFNKIVSQNGYIMIFAPYSWKYVFKSLFNTQLHLMLIFMTLFDPPKV